MSRQSMIGSILLLLTVGCSGSPSGPENAPPLLRGMLFNHRPTLADSVQVARFGQVVRCVRPYSLVLVMSSEDRAAFQSIPGVVAVGRTFGESPAFEFEIELGVGPLPTDSAAAIVSTVGRVVLRHDNLGVINGMVRADRLAELNNYPAITYLFVAFDGAGDLAQQGDGSPNRRLLRTRPEAPRPPR